MGVEADLISYYEAEARGRHRVGHGDLRHTLRQRFAALVREEHRSHLVDVGSGPGTPCPRPTERFDLAPNDFGAVERYVSPAFAH